MDELSAADSKFHCAMKVLESSVMERGYVHQGFLQSPENPFIRSVAASLRSATGREPKLIGCPCWTDGGLLAHYGQMPVAVYGPGRMEVAHSKEEYVTREALCESARVYVQMACDFCGLV